MPLMMQKMVAFSSFSVFFNSECSIIVESIIELTVYTLDGWMDFWFVYFQTWICVYVNLQYVVFE